MEGFSAIFQRLLPVFAVASVLLVLPVYGQLNTPCTASSLATFTPCVNFVTNSSLNGTSPSGDCCKSLKSVVSDGTDCFCLIATGSVPFRIPINRTLALSLPRACNMPGVPLLCKASGSPLPAPGPFSSVPTPSPEQAPAPTGSTPPLPLSPTLAPESDSNPAQNPPSPTVNSGATTTTTTNNGNRQSVTPSAASTQSSSPMMVIFMLGAIAALKNNY